MGELVDMVKRDTRSVQKAASSGGAMEQGAKMVRRFIRSRTRRGIDRHGQQFRPYAESTARKKGRFSPVTLEETSRMLDSLTIRTNNDVSFAPSGQGSQLRGSGGQFVAQSEVAFGAAVSVKGARNRRIARYHIEGAGDLPVRDWVGLTDREEQQVTSEIGTTMENAISREVPEDRRRRVQVKIF